MNRINTFRSHAYFHLLTQANSRKFSQPKLQRFKESKLLSAVQAARQSLEPTGLGEGAFRATNLSPGRRLAASLCGEEEEKLRQAVRTHLKRQESVRLCKRLRLHLLRALAERQKFTNHTNKSTQRAPDPSLPGTAGKRLHRCLTHPSAHKRELVPRSSRQHPLLPPSLRGSRAGAFGRLHCTRREENPPRNPPHTRQPLSGARPPAIYQPQTDRRRDFCGRRTTLPAGAAGPAAPARGSKLLR